MTELRRAVGSLIVVGLSGTELTALERAWLKVVSPGGIILFRRNIADTAQTRTLLRDATNLCTPHSFRCVDVEGGTVDRLRDTLAPMPSAQASALAHAGREHGELIAQGVRAYGFNTTLAPVLDLALPVSAQVMGTRTAGATAARVTDFAREFLAGLARYNIAGCGKHFPGLGGGTLDSHNATPSIKRTWRELAEDLAPYRALASTLPMVMVSHAAYPRTRGGKRPASVSPFWMTTVLRNQLAFRGIIFSDDLEMGGILTYMSMEDAAVESIRAGMDTIEICHSPEQILRAFESLLRECETSASFRKLVLARASIMARKRAALFGNSPSRALNVVQLESLRNRILAFGKQVNQSQHLAASTTPSGARALVETA